MKRVLLVATLLFSSWVYAKEKSEFLWLHLKDPKNPVPELTEAFGEKRAAWIQGVKQWQLFPELYDRMQLNDICRVGEGKFLVFYDGDGKVGKGPLRGAYLIDEAKDYNETWASRWGGCSSVLGVLRDKANLNHILARGYSLWAGSLSEEYELIFIERKMRRIWLLDSESVACRDRVSGWERTNVKYFFIDVNSDGVQDLRLEWDKQDCKTHAVTYQSCSYVATKNGFEIQK